MGSPARADSAYQRALAAYDEQAFDAARRAALEALAEQPDHEAARALIARLDSRPQAAPARPVRPLAPTPGANRPVRQGTRSRDSETISIDPTILIDRASAPAPAQIDPTMIIQREDVRRHSTYSEPAPSPPVSQRPIRRPEPPSRAPAPASDPTVMIPARPRKDTARSGGAVAAGTFLERVRARIGFGGRPDVPSRRSSHERAAAAGPGNGNWARGGMIALATVGAAALGVLGTIYFFTGGGQSGPTLTLEKPVGGTLLGPGLKCGTGGSVCSSAIETDKPVQIIFEADEGYTFTAFTGDCAANLGRLAMTQARTCGATFVPKERPLIATTWPLTVTKPSGGTVIGKDIECGTLGSACSTNVQDGQDVTLHIETDPGHQFLRFTGDCEAKGGTTTMTAARTCSATFIPSATPVANNIGGAGNRGLRGPEVRSGRSSGTQPPTSSGQPSGSSNSSASNPGAAISNTPPVGPTTTPVGPVTPPPTGGADTPPPIGDQTQAAKPITAEEHAKKEINQIVKDYCAEYESLKSDRVAKLYPQVNQYVLKSQFKEYKSLRCTATAPEYDRLEAGPAGGAQVKFGMKHAIVMKSGGAPKATELIVTMSLSRRNLQSPWLIDRAEHVEKPK